MLQGLYKTSAVVAYLYKQHIMLSNTRSHAYTDDCRVT